MTIPTIPPLPQILKDAASAGNLVPFVGAGASRLAGCPSWSEFADRALEFLVERDKLSYGDFDQLSDQNPRVKLSIARGLAHAASLQIDFEKILYPDPKNRNTNLNGRRLYDALSKLGTTFVTTNYDDWLDTIIGAPPPSINTTTSQTASAVRLKPAVFYNVEDLTVANLLPNTVLHLHGSIADPRSMVLTTRDYVTHYENYHRAGGLKKPNDLLDFLDFLFKEKNVLFVGYGLDELEILEYVINKARLTLDPGKVQLRHFLLQGFFSHEEALARNLAPYYAECGVELLPFSKEHKNWGQLIDILEEYARLAPAGTPLTVQRLVEMEALLDE